MVRAGFGSGLLEMELPTNEDLLIEMLRRLPKLLCFCVSVTSVVYGEGCVCVR